MLRWYWPTLYDIVKGKSLKVALNALKLIPSCFNINGNELNDLHNYTQKYKHKEKYMANFGPVFQE